VLAVLTLLARLTGLVIAALLLLAGLLPAALLTGLLAGLIALLLLARLLIGILVWLVHPVPPTLLAFVARRLPSRLSGQDNNVSSKTSFRL